MPLHFLPFGFDDCLVNYWEKVVQFDKYARETSDFLDSNQMFFPVEVSIKHLEVITILYELRKNAYDISFDRKYTTKERALKTFELFYNFNKTGISELRQELIDEYRLLIGVSSSKTVSANEYRLISEL
ncbi:hypothetical protein M2138_001752 [Dysgonomonadaceae bacterium PH5-43]|nr:hypothetical protein [Dysgonomonadaceae bacterium PH5-43]